MAETKFRNDMRVTGALTVEGAITGDVTGDVTGAVTLPEYTVATVPAAAGAEGQIIYVSDGNAGSPTVAVSDGTNWLNLVAGTAVASS